MTSQNSATMTHSFIHPFNTCKLSTLFGLELKNLIFPIYYGFKNKAGPAQALFSGPYPREPSPAWGPVLNAGGDPGKGKSNNPPQVSYYCEIYFPAKYSSSISSRWPWAQKHRIVNTYTQRFCTAVLDYTYLNVFLCMIWSLHICLFRLLLDCSKQLHSLGRNLL